MNNLIKAAFLPALTYLVDKTSASVGATSGAYAGVDLSEGRTFAGVQGRLNPPESPVQLAPSFEGAPRSDVGRWQLNMDVLGQLGKRDAFTPYAGAGLCVVGASEGDGMRVGFNLMGGASIALDSVNAFVQLRLTVADGVHLSLTGGALPVSS